VVMGAVDPDHAGAASGINNAAARVAGLLAIAVFGIVMVNAFGVRLDHELAILEVSQHARDEVQSNRVRLAATQVPSDIDPKFAPAVKVAVSSAFVFAFRIVACSSALLAVASAATATLLIDHKASP
jgi:hypothetical protein